jgi:hypothetical protein
MRKLLLVVFVLFVTSCSDEPKYNALGWTPKYRAKVKEAMTSSLRAPKNIADQNAKNRVCDCIVNRLEKMFPYGIPQNFSKKVLNTVSTDCGLVFSD